MRKRTQNKSLVSTRPDQSKHTKQKPSKEITWKCVGHKCRKNRLRGHGRVRIWTKSVVQAFKMINKAKLCPVKCGTGRIGVKDFH